MRAGSGGHPAPCPKRGSSGAGTKRGSADSSQQCAACRWRGTGRRRRKSGTRLAVTWDTGLACYSSGSEGEAANLVADFCMGLDFPEPEFCELVLSSPVLLQDLDDNCLGLPVEVGMRRQKHAGTHGLGNITTASEGVRVIPRGPGNVYDGAGLHAEEGDLEREGPEGRPSTWCRVTEMGRLLVLTTRSCSVKASWTIAADTRPFRWLCWATREGGVRHRSKFGVGAACRRRQR